MNSKKIKVALCLITTSIFLGILGGPIHADTIDLLSPLLIDVYSGNDNDPSSGIDDYISGLIKQYNLTASDALPEDLTLLGKFEASWKQDRHSRGYWTDGNGENWDSPYFNVSFTDFWHTQGTWTNTNENFDSMVFFSVKAGNQFALYYAGDLNQAAWDTSDLDGNFLGYNQSLSHISFWTATATTPPDTPANPVPEPTTLILLGIGMLGLARAGRKKFS